MGISGLHTFLQPYGKNESFSRDCVTQSIVVVDGPALAYHVWRANGLLEGEYRKFKVALEEFIHVLTHVAGFDIEVVYFDGYLPADKRNIRWARSNQNLDRVKRNRGSLVNSLPATPFVVPLAQDVLQTIDVRVQVVSEEADTACARYIKTHSDKQKCYLLSLDSDLHCFDLGPQGFYMPFDGLLYTNSSFAARVYQFQQTQAAVGVDLLQLVTLMGTEGSDQAPKTATEAMKLLSAKPSKFSQLISAAEAKRVQEQFSMTCPQDDGQAPLGPGIYGRLNEMCHSGEMWLPQLLEDCRKPSPWNAGIHYRASAYRILQEAGKVKQPEISEWVRRSDRVTGRILDLRSYKYIVWAVPDTLTISIQSIFRATMQRLMAHCETQRKRLSQVECDAFIVMIVLTMKFHGDSSSLRLVHLTAQYQAIVYSIMMLLQVQGATRWPLFSELYDLPTFLAAHAALQSGISIYEITRGHEDAVSDLIRIADWKSAKELKKAKLVSLLNV